MKRFKERFLLLSMAFMLIACSLPSQVVETPTPLPPTQTFTPAFTFTPEATLTSTITPTPTFSFPTATVNKQAHCRYGPSVAFLHAADLYPGDTGQVNARFEYSGWLYM